MYQKTLRVLVIYFEKGNGIKRISVEVEGKIVLEGNLEQRRRWEKMLS